MTKHNLIGGSYPSGRDIKTKASDMLDEGVYLELFDNHNKLGVHMTKRRAWMLANTILECLNKKEDAD